MGSDGPEVAAVGGLVGGDVEDEPGEEGDCLLLPEDRVAFGARDDEEVGEGRSIGIAEVGIGIDQGHGVEGRGLLAAKAEGIEGEDPAELRPPASGDSVVLALQIDDDNRARIIEEVGENGAHPLAAPGGGYGEDVALPVVAEEFPAGPAEDEAGRALQHPRIAPAGGAVAARG